MRIAITGASGLLGANVAEVALGAGHEVVCTRRAGSKIAHLEHLPVRWVEAELGEPEALARAFEGAEVVVHAAASVVVARAVDSAMREANVGGTRNVIDACRRAGVRRLVHVSTVSALGVSDGSRDVTEDNPFNLAEHGLLDGYAETKREAQDMVEAEARAGTIDAVVVCPTLMWGPYDAKPTTGKIAVALARGQLPGGTSGSTNVVDVRDVARGILLAAERGRTGERYILGGENVTYHELFQRVARIGGFRPPRFVVPHALAVIAGWGGDVIRLAGGEPDVDSMSVRWGYARGYRFSYEKASRELGYRPGNADEGIRAEVEWMRERGMLG